MLRDRVRDELVGGERVGVLLLLRRREGAELALHAADVRLVQVEVLDEVDAVVAAAQRAARGRRARRARAGRPTPSARGRPRGRAARRPPPCRGSGRASCRGRSPSAALACPVDDGVGQGFELVAVRVGDEERAGARGVVERGLARAGERVGRGDAHEGAVERAAGERGAHDLVLLGGEQQRHRRRALAQVGAGDLPRLLRLARAVEDVVGDLEGDPEREAERAERGVAARAEQARGLEELPGLERAALEVGVDRRLRVVRLAALHRLAAREREARVGERRDRGRVARRPRARRTRTRRGSRRPTSAASGPKTDQAAGAPRRMRAPSTRSSWTSVAMWTSSTATPAASGGAVSARGEARKQSSGRSRLPPAASASPATAAARPGRRAVACASRCLERGHVAREPGVASTASCVTRRAPVWMATIEPPSRRNRTSAKPASRSSAASSSAGGKRRTDAGR